MSSFHDQVFLEIDAARKLAAELANRHGLTPEELRRMPSSADRLAQQKAAAAEIEALAAEEERLASQARDRAEVRAKELEEIARSEEVLVTGQASQPVESRWNAMTILKGLAKLRAKERSAAEVLIRMAHQVRADARPAGTRPEPAGRENAPASPAPPVRGMWSPSLGSNQIWYFTSGGTRCGPVTFGELRTMASSRVLDPRIDMVWKEGMEGWKQAGLLDGLFERRAVPAESPGKPGEPHMITALPTDLTAALASKQMHWPGVGRLTFWLGLLLLPPLWSQLIGWSEPILAATLGGALVSKLLPFLVFAPVPVLVHLALMRLANVGMSRWWALLMLVPVLNLWIGFRCLICPSGYAHHRKLDRSGKATALALLAIAPALWYLKLKNPGVWSPEQLRPHLNRLLEEGGTAVRPR